MKSSVGRVGSKPLFQSRVVAGDQWLFWSSLEAALESFHMCLSASVQIFPFSKVMKHCTYSSPTDLILTWLNLQELVPNEVIF